VTYDDDFLRGILSRVRRIACVGVSPNPVRPSYFVARYMMLKGYDVFPVNPMHVGKKLFGHDVVADLSDLSDLPGPVDMVDIFRRSEFVPEVVDAALAHLPPGVIWMQIGVEHAQAAARAEAAGWTVVQNLCPKMEHQRLFGELRKAGIATGVISSRL